jgi:hypothetical protein
MAKRPESKALLQTAPVGARRPVSDWVIVGAVVMLFATGLVTVFDDEIARLRGRAVKADKTIDGVVAPPPGNATGL